MFNATDPGPQYELDWPRDLFVAEATALLEDCSNPRWLDDAELLLEEAFPHSAPKDDLRKAKWHDLPPELFEYPPGASAAEVARAFLTHLVNSAGQLSEHSKRTPYWSARQAAGTASTLLGDQTEQLQQDWVRLVKNLQDRGYLDCVAPQGCAAEPAPAPAAEVLATKLTRSLHKDVLWPLHYEDWDRDTFYSLIEAVHDLVARPRHRDRHNLSDCGWHYSAFAPTLGQALYRWEVDQLLDRHAAGLRLADAGEDKGRLVHPAGDDRDELVQRALHSPEAKVRDLVDHAVAQFRGRGATFLAKREATKTLADVLEHRKGLLKAELFRKDEDALFHIANAFEIRHINESQKGDYDPAFLDWVFWWYLATIELTDRLLARQMDERS
jgi:hypothetical protein